MIASATLPDTPRPRANAGDILFAANTPAPDATPHGSALAAPADTAERCACCAESLSIRSTRSARVLAAKDAECDVLSGVSRRHGPLAAAAC